MRIIQRPLPNFRPSVHEVIVPIGDDPPIQDVEELRKWPPRALDKLVC